MNLWHLDHGLIFLCHPEEFLCPMLFQSKSCGNVSGAILFIRCCFIFLNCKMGLIIVFGCAKCYLKIRSQDSFKKDICPGQFGPVGWISSINQKFAGSLPSQGTCLSWEFSPQSQLMQEETNQFFFTSMLFSVFPSFLSKLDLR